MAAQKDIICLPSSWGRGWVAVLQLPFPNGYTFDIIMYVRSVHIEWKLNFALWHLPLASDCRENELWSKLLLKVRKFRKWLARQFFIMLHNCIVSTKRLRCNKCEASKYISWAYLGMGGSRRGLQPLPLDLTALVCLHCGIYSDVSSCAIHSVLCNYLPHDTQSLRHQEKEGKL